MNLSRIYRTTVTIEVIALATPEAKASTDDLIAGVDVEATVRDAIQANDTVGSAGVWLVPGESDVGPIEELTPT